MWLDVGGAIGFGLLSASFILTGDVTSSLYSLMLSCGFILLIDNNN